MYPAPVPAAAAVRGGRGSQHLVARRRRDRAAGQRPPSAAAEDRNVTRRYPAGSHSPGSGRRPRRPRIATLLRHAGTSGCVREQRPPSAAAEDRNHRREGLFRMLIWAAAAVRGGRGSQHPGGAPVLADLRQRPPSARPRIATSFGPMSSVVTTVAAAAVRGGRGSQPRCCLCGAPAGPAAAAVRGGRGSQLHRRVGRRPGDVRSGRRPRRPRIATCRSTPTPTMRRLAAAAVRGGRGSQRGRGDSAAGPGAAAAAVRGGRGSQRV